MAVLKNNIVLTTSPPGKFHDENRPGFYTSSTAQPIFNYLTKTCGLPHVKITGYLNYKSFDEATITITQNDAPDFGDMTGFGYLGITTKPFFSYQGGYVTDYSFGEGNPTSIILTLKLDYGASYWEDLAKNLLITDLPTNRYHYGYVVNRHCNRWYYDEQGVIVPTGNYYRGNQTDLQYLSSEKVIEDTKNWLPKKIIAPDPATSDSVIPTPIYTFTYGNIFDVATKGATTGDAGGNAMGFYLETLVDSSQDNIPAHILNPVFVTIDMVMGNQSGEPRQANVIDYNDGMLFGTISAVASIPGYNEKTSIASPYLLQHLTILLPDPLPIGATKYSELPSKTSVISGNYLCVASFVKYNDQQQPYLATPLPGYRFLENLFLIVNYQATETILGKYTGSTPFPSIFSLESPKLPDDFIDTSTGSPKDNRLYTFANEFNRGSATNKITISWKYPTDNFDVYPVNKLTPVGNFDTKLFRLTSRFSIINTSNLKTLFYDFDKIGTGGELTFSLQYVINLHSVNGIFMPFEYRYGTTTYKPTALGNTRSGSVYNPLKYATIFENYWEGLTINSPAYNYLNQHLATYKTSMQQAKYGVDQSKYDFGTQIAKTAFGGIMGAVLGGVTGGVGSAIGGGIAGSFNSGLGIGDKYYGMKQAELKEQQVKNIATDESRQPDKLNSVNQEAIDVEYGTNTVTQNNFVVPLLYESYPDSVLQMLNNHFMLFGYTINQSQIVKFRSKDSIYGTRHFYNYGKITDFHNLLKSDIMDNELIIKYFSDRFSQGVRIGNLDYPDVEFKNYQYENWGENIYDDLV